METIYVLQLENDCWYVGKTSNLAARITQHAAGEGSAWTRLHRPLRGVPAHRIESVTREDAEGRETYVTARLMIEKGVNRVRGAMFCETRPFGPADLDNLARTIGHALNLAYKDVAELISPDLQAKNMSPAARQFGMSKPPTCVATPRPLPAARHIGMSKPPPCVAAPPRPPPVVARRPHIGMSKKPPTTCVAAPTKPSRSGCCRCGRRSHEAKDCFARTHVSGAEIIDSSEESDDDEDESEESEEGCYRCGRMGHWAANCYARRAVDGTLL